MQIVPLIPKKTEIHKDANILLDYVYFRESTLNFIFFGGSEAGVGSLTNERPRNWSCNLRANERGWKKLHAMALLHITMIPQRSEMDRKGQSFFLYYFL